ncbi:forkhead box protein R1 isoform X2 [Pleurodeles waltl]|uniref:forkhead box protein R1 isoform X2 n=1 Tax=Pleurodeles waltl TaxID=8319 RepID=UPI0037098765
MDQPSICGSWACGRHWLTFCPIAQGPQGFQFLFLSRERVEFREMFLRFRNRSIFEKLHLRIGLEDWDMEEELKLTATTDQYFPGCDEKLEWSILRRENHSLHAPWISAHSGEAQTSPVAGYLGCSFQPSLWLLVSPSKVCTWPYSKLEVPELIVPVRPALRVPTTPIPTTAQESSPAMEEACGEESEDMPSSSSEGSVIEDDFSSSSLDFPLPQELDMFLPPIGVPKRMPTHSKNLRLRRKVDLGNKWPRPPINYCILISVALRSSHGSLNVQQIYNFVREHFPFFRTAPEGWKNTVRHNLCFSSSFQKTTNLACGGSKRKSCLWKLTQEGRRKFQEEVQTLPDELVGLLRDSMYKPALMGIMFDI